MSKVYARISAIIMSVLCLVLGCVLVYDKTYRYNAEGETLVTTLGEGQPLKVQHLSFSSNPKDHWDDVIKEAQGTSSNPYIDLS